MSSSGSRSKAADEINLPQLLTNSVIAGLREKRKALEIEYQEKLETFKPSYPTMVQISSKIKEIDQQIAAEVNAIRESLKAAYESSAALEKRNEGAHRYLATLTFSICRNRSIQYNILKARGRHEPRALREPAAALQGG